MNRLSQNINSQVVSLNTLINFKSSILITRTIGILIIIFLCLLLTIFKLTKLSSYELVLSIILSFISIIPYIIVRRKLYE